MISTDNCHFKTKWCAGCLQSTRMTPKPNIYTFNVTNIEGQSVPLSTYKGKVLLIVNTASECGFTPQYAQLETLYRTYRDMGFTVLSFPCNDFGKQEPLDGKALHEFCELQFRTTFPVFEKVTVKGKEAHPLFQFLANKKLNGVLNSAPRWNFHKYLINRQGQVVDYFFPFTHPTSNRVCKAIEELL